MLPRRALVVLVVALAGCQPDRSQVVLPPEGLALDSTGRTPRRYLSDSLVLVASVGGSSDRDTTLFNPYVLTSFGGMAYVVDVDQRVIAFDTTGRQRWVQGKEGSGPGEYRNIRDLKVGPDLRVWVHDPSTARITQLDSMGQVAGWIPLDKVGHSEAMIPRSGGGATLLPPYADADILTIDSSGVVVSRDSIAWAGYHGLEHLSRQFRTAIDPATGYWVLGFEYGNGWFGFEAGRGSGRRYYVEPTRFPPVIKEVMNGGQSIGTRLVRTEQSGADLSLTGDTMFVLFGGKELRREKLDLYEWQSGNYLGSIRLPEKVDFASVSGRYIYTITLSPIPQLRIYRRAR
jgi:hypothetical protein